jgi:hypothetical protein
MGEAPKENALAAANRSIERLVRAPLAVAA